MGDSQRGDEVLALLQRRITRAPLSLVVDGIESARLLYENHLEEANAAAERVLADPQAPSFAVAWAVIGQRALPLMGRGDEVEPLVARLREVRSQVDGTLIYPASFAEIQALTFTGRLRGRAANGRRVLGVHHLRPIHRVGNDEDLHRPRRGRARTVAGRGRRTVGGRSRAELELAGRVGISREDCPGAGLLAARPRGGRRTRARICAGAQWAPPRGVRSVHARRGGVVGRGAGHPRAGDRTRPQGSRGRGEDLPVRRRG